MRLRYDATAPDAAARVAAGAKRAGCALVEQPRAGTFRLARIGEGGHAGVSDQKHCLRLGRRAGRRVAAAARVGHHDGRPASVALRGCFHLRLILDG